MVYNVTDFRPAYVSTSTTILSVNPAVPVPLLTIKGWILMQRKVTGGSVSFNQNWAEYRNGFGSASGNDNYWLGLDKIYRLVQLGNVRLRIEVGLGLYIGCRYSTISRCSSLSSPLKAREPELKFVIEQQRHRTVTKTSK